MMKIYVYVPTDKHTYIIMELLDKRKGINEYKTETPPVNCWN